MSGRMVVPKHVLFELSPLDGADDGIEDKTRRCYQITKQLIADKTTKECQETYLKHIALNPQINLDELTMGLLVAILLEPDKADDYYRDIVTFSKDNLALFGSYFNMLIIERMSKLSDTTLKQVFWIANQLMKGGCVIAENTCSNLIRQTAGGDLSPRNIVMVENLIDLLINNRTWLINSTSFMGPTVIYNFMRLIADHMGPAQAVLRQKEIDFVTGLIKEKFEFVQNIGKDFLRLLHNLIKIPEFEKLHQDIYNNPKALNSKYEGPQQLLAIRTPRRLFQSRLTFDMERKISFLATHVKFGSQKRYQDWFHRQYLSTPESLSLRCDLIRYICTIIHPSNEVLCSEIIPRWAIIGWLLATCTTSASAASSKQALFFDWFAFDSKTDNIMNIEPAILVMYYSLRSHPNVTASLLDYLCRVPTSFSPKLCDFIKAGIKKSLQQILEKRVIQSLAPLFDNPKQDPGLRALIRENFAEFCTNPSTGPITNPIVTIPPDNGIPNIVQQQPTSQSHPIEGPQIIKQPPEVILIDESPVQQHKQQPPEISPIQPFSSDVASNKPKPSPTTNLDGGNHITRLVDIKRDEYPSKVKTGLAVIGFDSDDSNDSNNTSFKQQQPPGYSSNNRAKKTSVSETDGMMMSGFKFPNMSASTDPFMMNDRLPNESMTGRMGTGVSKSTKKETLESEQQNQSNQLMADQCSKTNSVHSFDELAALDKTTTTFGPSLKVIYPFMTIKRNITKNLFKSFDDSVSSVLEDLNIEKSNEIRCTLMDKLISAIFDLSEQKQELMDNLGACVAKIIQDDFSTRIFPSTSQDNESLEESIASPLFVLCRSAFTGSKVNQKPLSLLASVAKVFDATGFLVLYFLRVNHVIHGTSCAPNYVTFCEAAKRKASKCLLDDLQMASTYDAELFCFMLPCIFSEFAIHGQQAFNVTNNIELIQLVVSTIDPSYLQELICLCLPGTARIFNRDDPVSVIESSLNWEFWEQSNLWHLMTAQVSVESYAGILPRLNARSHPVAMSNIILNLQKVTEPDATLIEHVCESYSKVNDLTVTSMIRYWAIKTDAKELAKNLVALLDVVPSSPQMKRKGQPKATTKGSSPYLGGLSEKILLTLESIRMKAPKSKLFAQTDLIETLLQIEQKCSEGQKKRFAGLFALRPKPTKKKKVEKDGAA